MMNWLYVSILVINNVSTYDVAVVNGRAECANKGKERIAQLHQQLPTTLWKVTIKCFSLPEGTNV